MNVLHGIKETVMWFLYKIRANYVSIYIPWISVLKWYLSVYEQRCIKPTQNWSNL